MILPAMILAVTVACADRAACPSHAEVKQAFRDQQLALEFQLNRDANPPGSESLTLISIRRIVRITGVRCGRPEAKARIVTCRARVYRDRQPGKADSVRLAHGPHGWERLDEDAAG
ncbi:MAG: hypothetical protein EOP59_18030 [Sphingomonadales bacterium]|nr:MAG: hypothetical protein EOP59_18030 [Sphingomonadales bacterium]